MTDGIVSAYACSGCGHGCATDEPYPFRCPHEGNDDDVDHILEQRRGRAAFDLAAAIEDPSPNPFVRFRRSFHSYHVATRHGLTDEEFCQHVLELDAAVAEANAAIGGEGKVGFVATPTLQRDDLAAAIGLDPSTSLWVKDETHDVSGSHKARHLMGIMIWLRLVERLGLGGAGPSSRPPLAIASCGNAALAAAVVAKAAEWPLSVYIPVEADPLVVERLADLGADLTPCPRLPGQSGDPCIHRFEEALASGALPFGCQGNYNGMTLEGGRTLAYELVAALGQDSPPLDHLVVQVGGGALAASMVMGLEDARTQGLIARLPRIHTVQTLGAYPLQRAWDRLSRRLLGESIVGESFPLPLSVDDMVQRGLRVQRQVRGEVVGGTARRAASHRGEFMWPWESTPESIATGILDDETYDWRVLAWGMLASGGVPLVVDEPTLEQAHHEANESGDFRVCATGSAGYAGLAALAVAGLIGPGESAAVLFTGIDR